MAAGKVLWIKHLKPGEDVRISVGGEEIRVQLDEKKRRIKVVMVEVVDGVGLVRQPIAANQG